MIDIIDNVIITSVSRNQSFGLKFKLAREL